MIDPGRLEEEAQQRWHARFARGRLGLSASVEETLAEGPQAEDLLADEPEEVEKHAEETPGRRNTALIPPRLSLQSKQLPAVRVEPDSRHAAAVNPVPATPPVEGPQKSQPAQKKQRLAGRSTKVRLQAVPKSEKKTGKKASEMGKGGQVEEEAHTGALARLKEGSTYDAGAVKAERGLTPVREKLAGSGMFQAGQDQVTIANAHITPSSVVMVTLLGHPGPVVVQYISLLPEYGFTIHLSAPAATKTPFNYVILLGELF